VSVVLDTSILIDVLRGSRAALEYLHGLQLVPACSEVTRVEVLRGLRSSERTGAERLFQALRWVPLDEALARRAGELARRWDRHRSGIGLADVVIAATAQQLAADLATTNVRHFPMFEGLSPPYAAD
jgi:predicted nucleic acid-binding protein